MWIYKGHRVDKLPEEWKEAYGFVYLISTETHKYYIGQKAFYSKRKKKFGKKKIAEMTDKRAKKYEYVIKESNWLIYTGSNKLLNEEINKGISYTKEILEIAYTKTQLTYLETKYLFANDVLDDDDFYNSNILGKFYKSK